MFKTSAINEDNPMTRLVTLLIAACVAILLLAACGNSAEQLAPAPPPPTNTPAPALVLSQPDTARGYQVWLDKQCTACHGPAGQGGIGPALNHTPLAFDDFLHKVRTALPPKPAFSATELPDQDAYNVYGWLQTTNAEPVANRAGGPQLAEGQVLGMTLWTQYECDRCHGAFAQGSADAPTLAGLTFPYEMERANMRLTGDEISQHQAEHIRDVVLQRLYNWLQAGASPQGGC